jgi:hypothetical protein
LLRGFELECQRVAFVNGRFRACLGVLPGLFRAGNRFAVRVARLASGLQFEGQGVPLANRAVSQGRRLVALLLGLFPPPLQRVGA